MDTWSGKVAIVTGASSGIGAAVCKDLCKWNVTVVGMARRLDKLKLTKEAVLKDHPTAKFHFIQCDVSKEEDINSGFAKVVAEFGGVDILINNAGVGSSTPILGNENLAVVENVVRVNLLAAISFAKKAYQSMKDRDAHGYIVNVSSVLGHYVPNLGLGQPVFNVYPSTKFAITALQKVLKAELQFNGDSKIRVSNISPGYVHTGIFEASGIVGGLPEGIKRLNPEDVSDAIMFFLSRPSHVQIDDMVIKPVGETF